MANNNVKSGETYKLHVACVLLRRWHPARRWVDRSSGIHEIVDLSIRNLCSPPLEVLYKLLQELDSHVLELGCQ